jgi:hypothetical protein
MSEVELKKRLLANFRDELSKEYKTAFGPELAWLSSVCDERSTFAIRYPSWANCR